MSVDFNGVADDFFVNMSVQTTLEMPDSRETILHFFEAVQKEFSSMTNFFRRDSGEYVLEGDRESGCYCWLELQTRSLMAGFFSPPSTEEAYRFHRWLQERSIYYLGVSGLDVSAADVTYGFNLDYMGNRDDIVSHALLGESPLMAVANDSQKIVEFEPSIIIALDDECAIQARVSVETRSNSYQVRTGRFESEPISVYLTIRQYPAIGQMFDMKESFAALCTHGEDMLCRIVIPQVVQPVAMAIAAAQ